MYIIGTVDATDQGKITEPSAGIISVNDSKQVDADVENFVLDPVTSMVTPVTIKVPPNAKPRKKKRMKLMEQFPPYLQV